MKRKRTLRGFIWYIYGCIGMKLFLAYGIRRYDKNGGKFDRISEWCVRFYGYARNPEWNNNPNK